MKRQYRLDDFLIEMSASEAEQRRRENDWYSKQQQAERIFAEHKQRSAAEAAARDYAAQQDRLRLEEQMRNQREQDDAKARAKDARINELTY